MTKILFLSPITTNQQLYTVYIFKSVLLIIIFFFTKFWLSLVDTIWLELSAKNIRDLLQDKNNIYWQYPP